MTMLARLFRFAPVLSFTLLTILLGLSAAPNARRLTPPEESEGPKSFDKPDVAQEFYRLKRAPKGQGPIPVERYLTALAHIKNMPVHFHGQHSFSPPRQARNADDTDE